MLANGPQLTPEANSKLPLLIDGLSCVGALGGTIASVVTQQVMFATVPLSVMFAVQVITRHKQQQQVNQSLHTHTQAIHSLDLDSSNHTISEFMMDRRIESHQQTTEQAILSLDLDNSTQAIREFTLERLLESNSLSQQTETENLRLELQNKLQSLEVTVETVRAIVADSQSSAPSSTEVHYNRGVNQEQLGHLDAAIADYTQVIRQEATHAFAYYRRGLAYLQLGQKQSALLDLNTASKHFFGEGDLANYEIAKGKVNEIHADEHSRSQIRIHSMGTETGNPVSVSTLFGN